MRYMKEVCSNCPFSIHCTKEWLGEERVNDILQDVVFSDKYFVCHETLKSGNKDKEMCCLGKVIFENKVNALGNMSTRMALMYKFITLENLKDVKNIIFNSVKEMISHHKQKQR